MNTKKNGIIPSELSKNVSFIRMLIVYLVICGVGVTVLLASFNGLIRSHDKKLTGDICSLVTEKINNSINYMSNSIENMSAVLSAQNHSDLSQLYHTLSKNQSGAGYVSIGLIDASDQLYASSSERNEFEKWNLYDVAKQADPVSISAPYRSEQSGQLVFTIFTNCAYGGGQKGYLFLTYPLSKMQDMAYTEALSTDTEIWLMEASSDNIIQCAGSNKYSIGVWDNALISLRQPIDSKYQDAYASWKEKMNEGEETAVLTFKIDNEIYTQVYSKIHSMHGWYVVVRIPSSSLSSAIEQFRRSIFVFLGILCVATVMMFIVAHRGEAKEKKVLENLSIQDPLTSALNRRAFDFTADQYLGYLGKALKKEASLLFFDIDYFKQVNDRFGHDAGDRILTGFSAALRDVFGNDGYISRYGGDEFVVLVRNGDKTEVSRQLTLLQKKAAQVRPCVDPSVYGDWKLTFSCGAAVFPTDAHDLKNLQAAADSALYIVKEKGRNGFGWYEGSTIE